MSNQTLFYLFGIGAAVSAVVVSFVGLKVKSFPGRALPLVVLWFAFLVGGATTFSVLHAQDEEEHKAHELEHANEVFEAEGDEEPGSHAAAEEEEGGEAEGEEASEEGAGTTLQLAADPSALAYDTTELSGAAGKVEIDLSNPSAIAHDVAIEAEDGKELAASEIVTEGDTSLSTELEPGDYTFFCTVPGHREAGMEGTLSVE